MPDSAPGSPHVTEAAKQDLNVAFTISTASLCNNRRRDWPSSHLRGAPQVTQTSCTPRRPGREVPAIFVSPYESKLTHHGSVPQLYAELHPAPRRHVCPSTSTLRAKLRGSRAREASYATPSSGAPVRGYYPR